MAVPRKKVSRMKRGTRRSADALTAPVYVEDKDSGERRRPTTSTSSRASIVGARSWSPRLTSEHWRYAPSPGGWLASMVPC